MRKWLLILLSLFVYANVWANNDSLSVAERNAQMGFNDTIDRLAEDFIGASILVADQGYELFSVLGHMAIRVKCPTFNKDYVFSYEGERLEHRFLAFMMNELKMGVFIIPAEEYLDEFAALQKGLTEYQLYLTPEQKIRLWEILDNEMMSVTEVEYDLFTRGCAANIRKWVTAAIAPDRIAYKRPLCTHGKLISDIFLEQTESDWPQFLIATLGGGRLVYGNTLSDLERLVTPHDVIYEWQRATNQGHPLLSNGVRLAEYVPIEKTWFSPILCSLLIVLLSLGNIFAKKTYIDWVLLAFYTLLGCIIVFAQFLNPMSVMGWSWLAIVFNPLPAIFWKWRDKWGLPYAIITFLWCVAMIAIPHRLTSYAHIIFAVAYGVLWAKPFIVKKINKINKVQ